MTTTNTARTFASTQAPAPVVIAAQRGGHRVLAERIMRLRGEIAAALEVPTAAVVAAKTDAKEWLEIFEAAARDNDADTASEAMIERAKALEVVRTAQLAFDQVEQSLVGKRRDLREAEGLVGKAKQGFHALRRQTERAEAPLTWSLGDSLRVAA